MDRKRLKVTILVAVIAVPLVSVLVWWGSQPEFPPLPTQEELDARLKATAVKADWVELVRDPEANLQKAIYAVGEVNVIREQSHHTWWSFVLSTREGDYRVHYWILDNGFDVPDSLSEGDWVIVWGRSHRKDESGLPQVLASIIEKL